MKTFKITVCVIPICIGNSEHWRLVMKFLDSVG